ncbi:cytochrome b [Citrobacter sp. wls830]|uniref:cytochrome b n=1 Tax=Citrobacter sp. wls615 TaxID=2576435 RepID=UPI0010C96540|nr:cytochrome b [Citrobacter sp. wls615]EGT0664769.1 cytochrome b [Citrobacter werkmanii]TKU03967.1 cytochrome b [Citrobacter sp. wls830]TKV15319.1 cytochrome b [Citrobacter sp. wls615]
MSRFSRLQIHLHWLTLVLIAITYATMEFRGWFPKGSASYLLMKETHYNAGVFVWCLMIIRLILKHKYDDPAITPTPPQWQRISAKLMHIMLYVSFLALPLLGVLTMAYGGKSWFFLGLNIPSFVHSNDEIKAVVKAIHETLANVGYFLIAAHAGAALFHHAIQKDNTLLRMMPEHKHLK